MFQIVNLKKHGNIRIVKKQGLSGFKCGFWFLFNRKFTFFY
jgi:hypothetical protein